MVIHKAWTSSESLDAKIQHDYVACEVNMSSSQRTLDEDEDEEVPHVVLDDLKYRRICTTVFHAELCMIVRFPVDIPLQDANVTFPKPVEVRMYQRSRTRFIDGRPLDDCRRSFLLANSTITTTPTTTRENNTNRQDDRTFHDCLEHQSTLHPDTTLVLFTRRRVAVGGRADWYGHQSVDQRRRVQMFFDGHHIVMLGASPTYNVAVCMADLFRTCQAFQGQHTTCDSTTMEVMRYEPPVQLPMRGNRSVEHRPRHMMNHIMPLMEFLRSRNISQWASANRSVPTTGRFQSPNLRPLTIMVEFPFAHMQTQDMISDLFDQVQYNQHRYAQTIMNLTTPDSREELARLGFELKTMIVFDGLPQHFPTETGGYTEKIHEYTTEREFLEHGGYPGWRPELGSACRGPLPPSSMLKQVNHLARKAFVKYGLDMNFYGKTWEFANQFWFQEAMWKRAPMLDCVHSAKIRTGLSCIHKYFVQAMVDGYYESKGLLLRKRTNVRRTRKQNHGNNGNNVHEAVSSSIS